MKKTSTNPPVKMSVRASLCDRLKDPSIESTRAPTACPTPFPLILWKLVKFSVLFLNLGGANNFKKKMPVGEFNFKKCVTWLAWFGFQRIEAKRTFLRPNSRACAQYCGHTWGCLRKYSFSQNSLLVRPSACAALVELGRLS